VLDAFILAELEDEATSFSVERLGEAAEATAVSKINFAKRDIETVRFGLKGWQNFKDKDGNERPFKTQKINKGGRVYEVCTDSTIRQIPLEVIRELAEAIRSANSLSEEEAKNSA